MAAANVHHMYKFYREPLLSEERTADLCKKLQQRVRVVTGVKTEKVFYLQSDRRITNSRMRKIRWLVKNRHRPASLSEKPFLRGENVIEVNPRLAFETPDSSNAVNICKKIGVGSVNRFEQGRRFQILSSRPLTKGERIKVEAMLHDPMVEAVYNQPIDTFEVPKELEPVVFVPVLEKGVEALREANKEYGLAMDEFDMNYYAHLVQEIFGFDLSVEAWRDIGNSNCEHSRHHIFRAKLVIDDEVVPFTLMDLIRSTLKNRENSIIAFHDNASAIRGFTVNTLIPERPGMPSRLRMVKLLYHFVLTCETHNHPCLWAADPGAATGRGGRYRDNAAVGRGAITVGGIAGFMGGNLNDPARRLPWEDRSFKYDPRTESPLEFFIFATNGGFRDANEAGEPLIGLFLETFGMRINGERIENVKPIMFSGGTGLIDSRHVIKNLAEKGWWVAKLGGQAFEIGLGGGAASSMQGGSNIEKLDHASVQRANGEMAKKVDFVIYMCVCLGIDNPIEFITDMGAGGVMNALKEAVFPAGAKVYLREIPVGDKSIRRVAILVAEYQESFIVLVKPEGWEKLQSICERENVPLARIGSITGDGKIVVVDDGETKIIDYELKYILGDYPQKTFKDNRRRLKLKPLKIPKYMSVQKAMELSYKHLAVGSMEWAQDKVDDSVTGLVVQGCRTGPLQVPISDYALTAASHLETVGEANSFAQRQTLGLISPEAMARMVAAEVLMKLMFVAVSKRDEIKMSANWMLPVKQPGGMAWLYDAALALKNFLKILEIDIDGGKDSMSLATQVFDELVKSLSTLVLTTYAACPDINARITPDIKRPGESKLIFIDLAHGKTRLGGSVFAQTIKQVGNKCTDADHPESITKTFDLMQELIREKMLLSGHAKGRGGLAKTLTEMAFAGNCGLDVRLSNKKAKAMAMIFNEELGLIVEYLPEHEEQLLGRFAEAGLEGIVRIIGKTTRKKQIRIAHNGRIVIDKDMRDLRQAWRETSYSMDLHQTTRSCVEKQKKMLYDQAKPPYRLTFDPDLYPQTREDFADKPRIAVLREEGTNSNREAWIACYLAGFEPWEVTLSDLDSGRVSLRNFRGIFFPGGFSYKDVLGSAVGFAAVIKFNKKIAREFNEFLARPDTFTLGVCNGCQLMAILGIAPWKTHDRFQPALYQNTSERFESRNPSVIILDSPSIYLKGMEGSILGVRSAHGEGRIFVPTPGVMKRILDENLAPIRFVDDKGRITEEYPFNPSGSPFGITALCDRTGRHLMFMEHPERTVLKWQWGWWPDGWSHIQNSPWIRMFQNMFLWCMETEDLSEEPLVLAA
ncbi:MAG: phosphoribosylformylglycinamidine synthase [Candidatus Moranbacteria bacterium]|nr:phosphoribosylformylglycinamidine synthase [Candidatus Moranbacteria bacterium]